MDLRGPLLRGGRGREGDWDTPDFYLD